MSETRTEPLFKIQGLRSGYGAAEVLHGIDLQVNEREAVAVLGPNGAGKTTLLRSVFQTCKVFGGSVKLAGTELLSLPPQPDQTAPPATIAIRAKKVPNARSLVLAD